MLIKNLLLTSVIVLMNLSVFARHDIFADSVGLKYINGSAEIPKEWNQLDYDDSNWTSGYGSVGWGDGDDSTIVEKHSPSVFIRIPFEVENANELRDIQFEVDYDDGFVAYINGKEIVRVNLGQKGDTVPFDQLADRSHEAVSDRLTCSILRGYLLDKTVVDSCIVEGQNILAIQVHNDSINGSDLSMKAKLVSIDHNIMNPYWYECRSIRQVDLDSSHLPIIEVNTDEYIFNRCKVWSEGSIRVINNGTNRLTDSNTDFSGAIGIKTRGNSSISFPKQQYTIEFRDSLGNDSAVSVLGMPAESDWILQASFADRSLIRNALAFEISKRTGEYAPRHKFCELVFNGEYRGVYALVEKIKRDKNRVNIKKLKPHEIAGVDMTGGYIFRYDKGVSGGIGIVYPDLDEIDDSQKYYIYNYVRKYDDLAKHKSFLELDTTYQHYMDANSYINYTITNEIAKNPDAYRYSTYFYKDRDDIDPRIHFGPVWDFDLAFGNTNFQEANIINKWQWQNSGCKKLHHDYLFRDTSLVNMYKNRWKELRASALSTESIMFLIDSLNTHLGPAIERNYQVWPVENKTLDIMGFRLCMNYDEDISLLKQWILDRLEWMDQNTERIYRRYSPEPLSISSYDESQIKFGPVPCVAELKFTTPALGSEAMVYVYSASGQLVNAEKAVSDNNNLHGNINTQLFQSGIYNAVIVYKNGQTKSFKFIKK